ncbi:uncharacterized protein [Parasteatoda tepidariorum]|uniref:uncharacterized protein n=1 Tax=Parasteatoda tepidariorum TaxID=114398 RepID=UPI001C718273|nr:uncharacterized protein LOC107442017 [Parasteatoda tepidariorum]
MGRNKRKRGHDLQNKSENLVTKRRSLIENLQTLTKANGLLVGTNAVLRNLKKKQLSAVFVCSNNACAPIFRAVSFWCKETAVPFFTLEADDRNILNSKIPVSVTYGIKKDSMHLHPQLEENLKEIKIPKIQEIVSGCESHVNTNDFEDISSKTVPIEEEIFVCHKKHSPKVKKSKAKLEAQKDFLAFCSSSDSEEEFVSSKFNPSNNSEFPEYKSVKWKDSDLIVK